MKQISWLSLPIATFSCLIPLSTQAQITSDGTTSTTVNQDGNNFTIEQGDRAGDNLFHSFNEFSVPTLGSAVFNNAGDIANIFGRVTGSSISNIDGLLGANGTANLYLINPNGIIFGENASLNLGGSFFASTADSLLFEGDTEFSAVNSQAPPLLEVSIPIGARFRDNPGDLVNRSVANNIGLSVAEGESISLIGGNVTLDNGLITTPGGLVEVGGVGSTGTVELEASGSLSFPDNLTRANIILDNDSEISTLPSSNRNSGNISFKGQFILLDNGSTLRVNNFGQGNAGNISLQASKDVSIVNSLILSNIGSQGIGNVGEILIEANSVSFTEGSQLQAGFFAGGQGNGQRGRISIQASESLAIDNSTFFANNEAEVIADSSDITISSGAIFLTNGAALNSSNAGIGNSGNINLESNNLSILDSSQITTSNDGEGNAGELTIFASESIEISNAVGLFAQLNQGGTGVGGNLTIETQQLSINETGISTSTSGQGDAGDLIILASDTLEIKGENSTIASASIPIEGIGGGASGNFTIETGRLIVTDNAGITTLSLGSENAGNITILASESIEVSNGAVISSESGLQAIGLGVEGNAGNLTIETRNLTISNGSQIRANTFGEGQAGTLTVNASESVNLFGVVTDSQTVNGLLTQTAGSGNGGELNINTGRLAVQDVSQIFTGTLADSQGKGGNLNITASESIEVTGESSDGKFSSGLVTLTNGSGAAGNLNITTGKLVVQDGAEVSASTRSQGVAGALTVTASESVELSKDSTLSTQTGGAGDAGDITIDTRQLIVQDGSEVSASTDEEGQGGNLTVNASEFVELLAGGGLFTQTDGAGDAGDITIDTGQLIVRDGSPVFTGTSGQGRGGDLTVTSLKSVDVVGTDADGTPSGLVTLTTDSGDAGDLTIDTRLLTVKDGALLSAQTAGTGKAGMLNIDADESVAITGAGSLRVSGVNGGTAGSLTISTEELTIADGGFISVSSLEGQAGNINITVDSLSQNQGQITAETGLSEGDIGANINFEISDIWRIDNESIVSATALNDADGGNININQGISDTEFLLFAFPPTGNNGSDITANASGGDGGRIEINTAGVFGIDFQDEQTSLNDFTVSSEFGSSGETIINRTFDDPTSGLINLPASVGDASDQISQNPCQQGVGSEFRITGKGGLPPSANEALNGEEVRVGLIEPLPQPLSYEERGERLGEEREATIGENRDRPNHITTPKAIPAMGWVFNDRGEVTLTAYSTSNAEIKRSSQQTSSSCSASSFENR